MFRLLRLLRLLMLLMLQALRRPWMARMFRILPTLLAPLRVPTKKRVAAWSPVLLRRPVSRWRLVLMWLRVLKWRLAWMKWTWSRLCSALTLVSAWLMPTRFGSQPVASCFSLIFLAGAVYFAFLVS